MGTGAYITYLGNSINDSPPGGNGNGIINPGESFRIPTWLMNYGVQAASGVSARLITHTPGVTVTDPLKSFGNIPAGDSAQNSEGFGMTVANGLPNNYAVKCSVVCRDDLNSTWVSYVTLGVAAPVLGFARKQVRNGRLDPGRTADLEVTISNTGLAHADNVRAALRSADSRLTVPDPNAVYGTVMVDSLKTNTDDLFTLTAHPSIPKGTPISCTLDLYADGGYVGKQEFLLVVGEAWPIDPIPDGPRQPPLYWAYDDADTAYEQRPVFAWVEIKSLGTRLNFTSNDAVIAVNLPPAFGPFVYYGQCYTRLSVSADGWVAPDSYTTSNYNNTGLPSASAPPGAICANWDDLYPGYSSTGYAYYYHDVANNRFVVEFDSVKYYDNATRDKFQFIFCDTTLAAADGNSVFLFQYLTANGYTSNTIGIQDPTRAVGIQGLFNGGYHTGCYQLGPNRAIKFTTDAPPVGIADPSSALRLNSRSMVVAPNPLASGFAVLRVQGFKDSRNQVAEVRVFDAAGRCVLTRSFDIRHSTFDIPLDCRRLSSGVYLVRLDADGFTATQKLVVQLRNGTN